MLNEQIFFKFSLVKYFDELKAIKMTAQKERFDSKIREMRAGQAKNVTMFSDREYQEFVTKINVFKNP